MVGVEYVTKLGAEFSAMESVDSAVFTMRLTSERARLRKFFENSFWYFGRSICLVIVLFYSLVLKIFLHLEKLKVTIEISLVNEFFHARRLILPLMLWLRPINVCYCLSTARQLVDESEDADGRTCVIFPNTPIYDSRFNCRDFTRTKSKLEYFKLFYYVYNHLLINHIAVEETYGNAIQKVQGN